MPVLDDDVLQLFERIFRQRAERARICDKVQMLEGHLRAERHQLELADEALKELDAKMARLADRAAGVPDPVKDEPLRASEFRAVPRGI